jgi:hypothetical protein
VLGAQASSPARIPLSRDRDLGIDATHLVILDGGKQGRLRSQTTMLEFFHNLSVGGFGLAESEKVYVENIGDNFIYQRFLIVAKSANPRNNFSSQVQRIPWDIPSC